MILVIDNYDSFTYNIVQYAGEINNNICVHKNDQITTEKIKDIHLQYHIKAVVLMLEKRLRRVALIDILRFFLV